MARGKKQSAELVADRIVACLRRPKGEVWTHLPTRLLLGVSTAFPAFADWVLAWQFAARKRNAEK